MSKRLFLKSILGMASLVFIGVRPKVNEEAKPIMFSIESFPEHDTELMLAYPETMEALNVSRDSVSFDIEEAHSFGLTSNMKGWCTDQPHISKGIVLLEVKPKRGINHEG